MIFNILFYYINMEMKKSDIVILDLYVNFQKEIISIYPQLATLFTEELKVSDLILMISNFFGEDKKTWIKSVKMLCGFYNIELGVNVLDALEPIIIHFITNVKQIQKKK